MHVVPSYDKHVHFKVDQLHFAVGGVHVEISGIFGKIESWIINTFFKDLSKVVEDAVNAVLQKEVAGGLGDVLNISQDQLPLTEDDQEYFVKFDFPEFLHINYSLTHAPEFKVDHIYMPLNGTIYSNKTETSPHHFASDVKLPEFDANNTDGIQLFLSNYVFETALYALYKDNILKANISTSMLPKGFPFKLDTSSLNFLFPHLKKHFGKNQPCYFTCDVNDPDFDIEIIPSGASQMLPLDCQLFAFDTKKNDYSLAVEITTDFNFTSLIHLNSTSHKVFFNLTESKISNTKIAKTNIGDFAIEFFEVKVNFALTTSKAAFNEFLAKRGIPIPDVPNTIFDNSTVALKKDYVEITFNPTFTDYTPSAEYQQEDQEVDMTPDGNNNLFLE